MHHDSARYFHRRLSCGIEFGAEVLSGRKIASIEIRVLSGMSAEPADKLGLAFLTEQTISKGTAKRTGPQLLDAFDVLGALHGSWVGRESLGFRATCLPEYLDAVIDLHAELIRTPTFPADSVQVAIDLANQEITAMEDDPGELSRKLTMKHAYGPVLGRHAYGERETLATISRDDVVGFWKQNFRGGAMQVVVGGPVDPERLAARFEQAFAGFGAAERLTTDSRMQFTPGRWHYHKELEQQHIAICWPGLPMTAADYPIERVLLAVLGDGMSSRLFTEVREKQGLVYWVGAWHEHPRTAGMIHLGASSTPERCETTHQTLLREVDRLAADLSEDELERAKTLIIARSQTHGDITRARVSELASDLFYYGRPLTMDEKNAAIQAVTVADVRRYLSQHPRDRLCVVTLGPAAPKD